MQKANHLINETSPYLLQHAYNPVDWYPWGDTALNKAKAENKPILISIGYAACHWCHVMERESFEDNTTAQLMNSNFINIKIDREERPDLDHIYMDAVQAITGSGGWPLNVFLTPEAKPFYGGTYFPPNRAHNRPSWQEVLTGVTEAFVNRRNEIDKQAENLTAHLLKSYSTGQTNTEDDNFFTPARIEEAVENILKMADREWGGFGRPPKFPQTSAIRFLLRYAHLHHNNENSTKSRKEAFDQAILSLDKMISGGIYDQIGGGFARYATDSEWLVPHFEKMLYDNALLIMVICEAYQLTKNEKYKEVIDETITFVTRELMHPDGVFYAALDADSEGEEGRYYVWSKQEADEILGELAPVIRNYYDITGAGNWEHSNILWVRKKAQQFAYENNIDVNKLEEIVKKGKAIMLAQRQNRHRPLTDDKAILGWNALMNAACSTAYAATGNEVYKELAETNMQFLLSRFSKSNSSEFFHTWKNGIARIPAFLDDYAFLIKALIQLHDITADKKWLMKAKEITTYVIDNFSSKRTAAADSSIKQESDGDLFYYTPYYQHDVIVRKTEIYDGAVPSGNSVMAENLLLLSIYFDVPAWKQMSTALVRKVEQTIVHYPSSFGYWACLWVEMVYGTNEIVIIGKEYKNMLSSVIKEHIPNKVIMASHTGEDSYPLLAGKHSDSGTSVFLCSNYTCHSPVFSLQELISLINKAKKG
ncbi:MAG: thioredoxin domain-containing protein [Chitinophagaceae bacterium]|nr:thioredoxin domain-containing protein [Chitinophagaceae bacterium]